MRKCEFRGLKFFDSFPRDTKFETLNVTSYRSIVHSDELVKHSSTR